MTLSIFRAMSHHGHFEHVKHVCGYLAKKIKDTVLWVQTAEPDYSRILDHEYDWERSVYGDVSEIIPPDVPTPPLGKDITLTHYFDANLYYDMLAAGHSVTGILHLFNKMPIEWFSKKQATVETATYAGSEFIMARTCVDQIINLCTTLLPWCAHLFQELCCLWW